MGKRSHNAMKLLALLIAISVPTLLCAQQPENIASVSALPPAVIAKAPALDALLVKMLSAPAANMDATVVYATDAKLRTIHIRRQGGFAQNASVDGALFTREFGVATLAIPELQKQQLLALMPISYRISQIGLERVADRPSYRLEFNPNDGWRYRYVLWLDSASGVALKSELWHQQRLIENMLTTQIQLSEAPAQLSQADALPAFRVINTPAVFIRVRVRDRALGGQQQVFSDGLAFVSVYLTPIGKLSAGNMQRGALSISSKRIRAGQTELHVIALGDAPMPTVERFSSGVVVAGN